MGKRSWTTGGHGTAGMVILLLLVFIGYIAWYAPVAGAAEKGAPVPPDDAPFIGPKDAPVTIVEFVDYQ